MSLSHTQTTATPTPVAPRRTKRAQTLRRAATQTRALNRAQPAPVLKWVGGKSRLLEEISNRMPNRYGTYFEPFVGGGALFFHTAPKRAVLGDCNSDLINVYTCVAWQLERVARHLAVHKRNHSESYYYEMRDRWNARSSRQSPASRAALFLYMNKTCYNGLWRVNRKGDFNVPVGRYENPAIYDLANLKAASDALKKCELYSGHYSHIVDHAKAGDFVYFDPPYHPLTTTSNFTSYTKMSFSPDDQKELADVAKTLADRGCFVLLSNSDTPFIREIYADWHLEQVQCGRSINSKAKARGAVSELLISTPT